MQRLRSVTRQVRFRLAWKESGLAPTPPACPVSAVCCNAHRRGLGFAELRPGSGRRMGTGLTTADCIRDIRSTRGPSGAKVWCLPEEKLEIDNSCLRRSGILPRRNPLCNWMVSQQRVKDGTAQTLGADLELLACAYGLSSYQPSALPWAKLGSTHAGKSTGPPPREDPRPKTSLSIMRLLGCNPENYVPPDTYALLLPFPEMRHFPGVGVPLV
jgi:hypothetical protein